ncbi:hypothetical protein M445_12455 [Vibrio owensii 47666-1]|nr:hypothetical protein M445_12455 [Vibrio owensii 47666-1]
MKYKGLREKCLLNKRGGLEVKNAIATARHFSRRINLGKNLTKKAIGADWKLRLAKAKPSLAL